MSHPHAAVPEEALARTAYPSFPARFLLAHGRAECDYSGVALLPPMSLEISVPSPTGVRGTFAADDGETLNYKQWAPAAGFSRALVLLHRGHEHADRWDAVVPH